MSGPAYALRSGPGSAPPIVDDMTADARPGILRRTGWIGAGLLAVALLIAGAGDDSASRPPGTVRVLAGPDGRPDPAVAVLAYLPEAVTVTGGSTVEWRFPGPEQHSVTFFPTGQSPPPGSDPSLAAPTLAAGRFDGRTLVNSGPVSGAPAGGAAGFRVTFPTAGSYTYVCVLHPRMTGTVNVVEEGARTDTQADVDSRARSELARWVEEGRAARRALDRSSPGIEEGPDGATTWRIAMGTASEHTDVLAFSPAQAEVRPGDRVVFVNDGGRPHTATFAGRRPLPPDPAAPQLTAPVPGPSPQALNATDLFGTGILAPGPTGTFTFVVPTAGTYSYVCVIHRAGGMAGSVKVA